MKRRILSLLLALCLIVGLLPMAVLAEDAVTPTSTLTVRTAKSGATAFTTWTPALSIDMAPAYAKTTEEGLVTTEGASATDWNLKVEWTASGKPTLTMKDATLLNDLYTTGHTVYIGGTADFVIALEGANTITVNPTTGTTGSKTAASIYAENTGTLTICNAKDGASLVCEMYSYHNIVKKYNALTIENTNVTLNQRHSASNTYGNIIMSYGKAGLEDLTNLTVRNSTFTTTAPGHYANGMVVMAGTSTSYAAANTGNILFQNSIINMSKAGSVHNNSSSLIRYSVNGSFTIDRCDAYLNAPWFACNYTPTVVNCDTYQIRTSGSADTNKTLHDNTYDAGVVNDSTTKVYTIKTTHTCLEGEPVIEKGNGPCVSKEDTVTYCIVCNKELSRTSEPLEPSKAHIPGVKTELTAERVNAGLEFTSDTQKYYRTKNGTIVYQHTCAVCGETWKEEQTFKPAFLYYITSGAGAYDSTTTKSYNYNAAAGGNTGKSYGDSIKDTINPGTTLYFETIANDNTLPDNRYMVKLAADDAKIASGDWNVKFEYPVGGNPVMTLKDATIINNCGLWYGYAAFNDIAPLTIVLKGENKIQMNGGDKEAGTQGAATLNLMTNNPVTITGDGTLYLESWSCAPAIRTKGGDLILDGATISIVRANYLNATTSRDAAIATRDDKDGNGNYPYGDIVIKGGKLDITCFGNTTSTTKFDEELQENVTTYTSSVGCTDAIVGNNVILQDANITAHGTFGTGDDGYAILRSRGDMTIIDSTLVLAHGFGAEKYQNRDANVINCGGTLTWDYVNGFTANWANNKNTVANDPVFPTEITYPATTEISELYELEEVLTGRYLDIAPVKARAKFYGSNVSVQNDLTLKFAIAVADVPAGSVAYITRTRGEEVISTTTQELTATSGYHYISCTGIAAKEMHDVITVVIKNNDVEVSETRTDSIYDYALRMLAKEQTSKESDAKYAAKKTVLVELLNYGTMAQMEFNHNTENPANAGLTVNDWTNAITEMKEVSNTAATITLEDGAANTTFYGTNVSLKFRIQMSIAVTAGYVTDGSYANIYVDGVLKQENVAVVMNNSYATYTSTCLVAADGRKNVTFELFTADGVKVATVTDSLANYVGRNIAKGPHLANLMNYCDAAEAFFTAE